MALTQGQSTVIPVYAGIRTCPLSPCFLDSGYRIKHVTGPADMTNMAFANSNFLK